MSDYRKNIDKRILDLKVIKQMLDDSEIYEDEDGNELQTIYLGSILSLTPSGKIYTPWASSNVDCCPRCEGTGHIKNPKARTKKYNSIQKQKRELLKNMKRQGYDYPMNWPKNALNKLHKLHKNSTRYMKFNDCQECHGHGSLEARLDQDWWEQLERELDAINAWNHGSEGDGCDILISRYMST